jgi:hypothetical protein
VGAEEEVKERVAGEEVIPHALSVRAPEEFLVAPTAPGAPPEPPEGERNPVVEPNHEVGAIPEDVLDAGVVVAGDDPGRTRRGLLDVGAELIGIGLLPIGLPEKGVEFDKGDVQASRDLLGQGALTDAGVAGDDDAAGGLRFG